MAKEIETEESEATGGSDPNMMTSLARGLEVIQAFSRQDRSLTISQISQKTGIPRAAVRRCLYTLNALGFAGSEDGRLYFLRPRILALGHAYLTSSPLARIAQPLLRRVSNELRESCSVAILDGYEILYIARASVSRIMTIDLDVGSRLPAAYTSMGRVLLAGLPDAELDQHLAGVNAPAYTPNTLPNDGTLRAEILKVRAQGYALIDQELEIGLRSIAAPIRNMDGRVVASINVGAHASQISVDDLTGRILPALQTAAAEMSLFLA